MILMTLFRAVTVTVIVKSVMIFSCRVSDSYGVVGDYDITRVATLIVATIYLQLIQNRYMFRSFTVLHCSHQHCVQHVASDVEFVGYLQQHLLC